MEKEAREKETAETEATEKLLQVRLNDKEHKALKQAAQAVHCETKSALVRCFADAIQRKSVAEVRRFLFTDEAKRG